MERPSSKPGADFPGQAAALSRLTTRPLTRLGSRLATYLDPLRHAARASLVVLSVLLLTTVCTILACRGGTKPAGSAGFDLLDDTSSPNLNDTSAGPRAPAAPSDSDRLTAVTSNYQAVTTSEAPQVQELGGFALPETAAAQTPESFAIPRRH